MRAHYASRLRLPLDIAVVVGSAVLGAYELRSGSRTFGIVLLCLSGIFALMLVAAFAIIPKIAFRMQPKFRDDYSLTFSPQGIHFRTAHIDSDLQWSMYTRALVDAHSIILYYGSQQFTVIPKRTFQDVAQRETFERLLVQNIPNVIDKTK
jgi:YcxB-like protein